MEEMLNTVLLEVLKITLITIFSLLVPILIQHLRRAGISVNAEREALLNQIAMIAAAEAEEWASKKLKHDLPVSSAEKSDRAIGTILHKLPKVNSVEAKSALDAALPQIGLGASARLKELEK